MNTFTKVANMSVPATHPEWGPVTILSKWQNSRGRVLHQVSVPAEAAVRFTVVPYASLSKGDE